MGASAMQCGAITDRGEMSPEVDERKDGGHVHEAIPGMLTFSGFTLYEACECGARREVDILQTPVGDWRMKVS